MSEKQMKPSDTAVTPLDADDAVLRLAKHLDAHPHVREAVLYALQRMKPSGTLSAAGGEGEAGASDGPESS